MTDASTNTAVLSDSDCPTRGQASGSHRRARGPTWLAMALLVGIGTLGSGQRQVIARELTVAVQDSRVTNDNLAGSYKRYDGQVDPVMSACGTSRRAQVEPSVSIDPHDPRVVMATATDRCNFSTTFPSSHGGEEGVYRSTDGGRTWEASLAPGYQGDTSPAAASAIGSFCTSPRHGEADSTLAFDMDGTAYLGFLCGNGKGPVAVLVATYAGDGSRYQRTVLVSPPSSGESNDKPNLAVDRSAGASRGNIYVAWDRTDPNTGSLQMMVAASTDHGKSFVDSAPLTGAVGSFASLAVGPDGVVYLAYLAIPNTVAGFQVMVSKSTDQGRTFSQPTVGAAIVDAYPWLAISLGARPPEGCGDGPTACPPGYTGPIDSPSGAIAADETGVHLVWDAYTPLGQEKIYFANSADGVVWPAAGTTLDTEPSGHQFQPAITSAGGTITVAFYDSRHDAGYAPLRPVGNTADGKNSGPSLDAFAAQSADGGVTWTERRLSTRSWSPNWETHLYARGPWQGEYLYADSIPGRAFVVWTDNRDVVPGVDTRETGTSDGFDVLAPCAWAPGNIQTTDYTVPTYHDPCLSKGGLDVNIYGAALTSTRQADGTLGPRNGTPGVTADGRSLPNSSASPGSDRLIVVVGALISTFAGVALLGRLPRPRRRRQRP